MKEYIIRPIPLSEGTRDKGQWTYRMNYGQSCLAGSYVWYIEGSEPKALVDCGASTETFLSHGLEQKTIQSLEEGLARIGLKPEDIGIVIQTHLHFDHVELAYKMTRAKFIVQKAELDYAFNPHPISKRGYDPRLFQNLNLELVNGDKEIIEGIQVILTPGHSPGGQSVLINTRKGTAIITGLCCTMDNFELPVELKDKGYEVIAPGLHINAEEAYDNLLKIKKMADIIVPLHDPTARIKDTIP